MRYKEGVLDGLQRRGIRVSWGWVASAKLEEVVSRGVTVLHIVLRGH